MTTVVTELLPGSVIVRFRVGGKAEKRLNKTDVEEILSEHFVAKGNSSNSVKLDYVMDVCPGLHCSHSCLFNYTLLKQVCVCPIGMELGSEKDCVAVVVTKVRGAETSVGEEEKKEEKNISRTADIGTVERQNNSIIHDVINEAEEK